MLLGNSLPLASLRIFYYLSSCVCSPLELAGNWYTHGYTVRQPLLVFARTILRFYVVFLRPLQYANMAAVGMAVVLR